MRILHVALPQDWARGHADGSYAVSTRGVSLVDEGYIHASTLAQVGPVLDGYFADVAEVDLLVIDLDKLDHEGAQVVWEHVDGSARPFPHVYGVIPAQTVTEVIRLQHEPGTAWQVPDVPDVAAGPSGS